MNYPSSLADRVSVLWPTLAVVEWGRRPDDNAAVVIKFNQVQQMANKWGIPNDVEKEVLARDKVCVYCGVEFGAERKSMRSWEHIINDVNIATMENIALCCVGCNASKGAKLLHDWIDSPNAKRRGITCESLAPVVLSALGMV
jgi:hypothetical protein